MITYNAIVSDILSILDAEGSSYYLPEIDIVPALNRGQDFILELISKVIGAKKFSEESLKGLIQNRIFQPSNYSRIYVDGGASETWGIISVLINPIVAIPPALTTTFVPTTVANNLSISQPTYVYISGGQTCKRLNSQEFLSNRGNPFEAGFVDPTNPTPLNVTYGYLSHVDTQSQISGGSAFEISINPPITSSVPVSITFIKYPTRVTYPALNNVDFDPVFQRALVRATCYEMSLKQGDPSAASLFKVTLEEIEQIMGSLS